jgi:hypothetical protein
LLSKTSIRFMYMEMVAGGRMRMDTEAKGEDLEHCYACDNELKHPRDGAWYQAGHRTGRLLR